MNRRYEVVYIFDASRDEAQVNQTLDRHHSLLKTKDTPEPVLNLNHWGVRTLAYPIRRRETGYYVVADLNTEPSQLPEFERSIKLDESVIRHLVVLNEGRVSAPPRIRDRDDDDDDLEDEDE